MKDTTVLALVADTDGLTGFIFAFVIMVTLFVIPVIALVLSYRVPPGETIRPDATGPPPVEFNFTQRQRKLLRQSVRDVARRTRRGEVGWRFEDNDPERNDQ